MKRCFNPLSSAATAATCAILFLLPGTRVSAGNQVLQGHVPAAVNRLGLSPLRHFDGTNHLKLAIGLPLRDKEGLTNLLQQIYDPASGNYHHYLTAPQFAERFGPRTADYQTLIAFAAAHHLTVTGFHPNRTLLDVDGSVADIEKALHVTMQVYRHPIEHRDFFAPDKEPSLDLNLPVLHISGLDNFLVPHPMNLKQTPLPEPASAKPASGSGPGGNYLGYDFRAAYIPGVALTGTGQTVGLLEFDSGFFQNDITAYESLAGLPNVPVTPVLLDGYNGGPGFGNDEVSLDIEMAISMAPGLSGVRVYEGDITDDILNRMATENVAKQIGASWTYPIDPNSDQIFLQYGTQGQSFYNAAGDSDAYVGLIPTPADDPNIISVGGTTLTTSGPGGSWVSEKVWNWGGGEGGSGGISTVYSIPSWQLGINMVTNHGSTTMRNIPDVALTADNIWVLSGDGQAGSFGGTSCATPLWAAFTALVNQQAAANGEPTQGFINPAVYAIGKGGTYASCFHDIVLGDDTWSNSPNNFFAVPGYDLATGWGTPNGSNLINTLAPVSLTPVLAVVTNIISGGNGNGVIDFDECNNLTIILTNEGGVVATGIEATLTSSTLGAIVAQGSSAYPTLFPHGSAANLSLFTLSTEPTFICGTPIDLTLVVKCDQVIQTNYIQLTSGVVGSPDSFTNATAFPVPNTNFVPINSPIVVSGLQAVGKITVSVFLAAQYDAGLSLNLIGPNGTNVLLSQFNGGFGSDYGLGCAQGSETTFDDAATTPIGNGSPPFVGSFQPQQPLSVFNLISGTNLNGVWNLQVLDEFPGDTAVLECWALNISPEVCLDGGGQCPGADLSLTMSANPNPVYVNSNLVYNLTVSNAGPGTADNVIIIQTLPPGVGFVTTTNYPVSASQSGSNLNLLLGSLPVYGSATVAVVTIPTIPGFITSVANVGSQDTDPNPDNNTASATVLVSEQTADLAVTMTSSPASVLQGGLLTYTINVTNNGPFAADGATLTTVLPANANFISATTSQGTLSFNGTLATLGGIGLGTNVVVTIVVSPTITGNITASTAVTLSPPEVDPNTFNNSASVTTTVGPAADLAVTAVATPSPVVAGSNLTYIATVTNIGPSAATGVVFSQSLPAGSTFVSSSLAGSVLSNNLITGTIGNLASGASVLVTNVVVSPTLLPGVHSQLMISTISVFGQPGDPNPTNNVVTLQTVAEPPTVTIVPAGANVISGSSNGSLGPSGTFGVQFFLQNTGTVPTTNLVATLLNSNGVTLASGPQTYGVLMPGAAPTVGQYSFTASSTNGGTIVALLQLQDGTNNLGTVAFTFVMPVVQTFWNTNFISIPSQIYIPEPDSGPANPYPSAIAVSNVNGDVATVTVTISNLFHTYPNDIGMLLIGPSGASCDLMSAVANYSTMISPATITFNQNASLVLPAQGQIVSGSYQPADYFASQYGKTETYTNSPDPVGPYNTNLAVFGSIVANGTWRLYIEDDANGDAGAISNGWGLTITTITPVNQVADLAAGIVALTNQVILGNNATNIWTITNNGPNAANAFVTNILSSGLTVVTNVLPPGATNIQTGPANVYSLGNLVSGSGVAVTNVVMATASGPQTNAITVGSTVLDGNPGNNSASVVITVNPPPVDLAVGPISVVPNPVVVSGSLVLMLYVTNNGPSNAFNVVGSFKDSNSLQVVSAVPSQGNCVISTGVVQCNLGTISNGQFAVVTLTATALSVGLMTDTWSVATTSADTNLSNNSTSVQVTVTLPTPLITNGPATLLPQGSPPLNGAINSNQTNTVSFTLTNIGSGPTTNLVATLLTNSGLRPITTSHVYGAIAAGGSASQSYTFVGSGSPGATITAEFLLQDGSNTNLGPVFYTFMIPMTQNFTNSALIIIPDVGPGSPYPSIIQVSTLTNGLTNLLVSKVTASLNGFMHSFPHDVEAVLVSPTGQELVLMEHTGGPYGVSNLVLTFDDAATQALPTTTLFSGTFLATAYAPFDIFPTIGTVPSTSTNLAVFNGMNPNGIWSLYVYDDTPGNDGEIVNGWSLGLTAVSTVSPAALLAISTIEAPNPAIGGDYVNYQITVSNLGPSSATSVVLTDLIPAGTFLAPSPVTLSQGSYTTSGGTVTGNLGTISNGAFATLTLKILVESRGTITNTVIAATASADLYLAGSTNITITPVGGNQAPYLSALSLPGGVLQLTIDGYAGQNYAIQISSNLVSWTTISTNSGSFNILDTSTNARQRFYRAIQLPQ